MKSYTNLEQSRKLAEILSLEGADMCYIKGKAHLGFLYKEYKELGDSVLQEYEPCWSLASLYNILPNNEEKSTNLSKGGWNMNPLEYNDKWWCEYEEEGDERISVSADNPIDACYEMIVKLHELNLL